MDTIDSVMIPEQLRAEALVFEHVGVPVLASTTSPTGLCPSCRQSSRRVHSRYVRTIADLPWGGVPVRFRVRVRKFFCNEPSCPRTIFVERLDGVAGRYARRTDRQREALDLIAFALGGEAGARLALSLGLRTSADTLLNYIRQWPGEWYAARCRRLGYPQGAHLWHAPGGPGAAPHRGLAARSFGRYSGALAAGSPGRGSRQP